MNLKDELERLHHKAQELRDDLARIHAEHKSLTAPVQLKGGPYVINGDGYIQNLARCRRCDDYAKTGMAYENEGLAKIAKARIFGYARIVARITEIEPTWPGTGVATLHFCKDNNDGQWRVIEPNVIRIGGLYASRPTMEQIARELNEGRFTPFNKPFGDYR